MSEDSEWWPDTVEIRAAPRGCAGELTLRERIIISPMSLA